MKAKVVDYEFKRGDTYELKKFRILDKDKNVIVLTQTDQLYFTLKKDANSSNVLLQKKIGSGITLEDDGYYHITLESYETGELNYGDYQYDIELKAIEPKEYVRTIIEGTITLTEEITWKGDE